jgi:hypothetical protein
MPIPEEARTSLRDPKPGVPLAGPDGVVLYPLFRTGLPNTDRDLQSLLFAIPIRDASAWYISTLSFDLVSMALVGNE